MMHQKKIKAFSLIETLIAMMLSGILLSLIYISFSFLFKEYALIRNKGFKSVNNHLFYSYLYNDFNKIEKIIKLNDNKIQLLNKTREINYVFNPDFVLRENGNQLDTFKIQILDFQINTLNFPSQQLVKGLNIGVKINDDLFTVKMEKEYLESNQLEWKDE